MNYINWNMNKLPKLVQLWNNELGTSFPMREELFAQNSFDDNNVCYESSQMVVDEIHEQVIGFVIVKRWQEGLDVNIGNHTGWIQAILVDHRFRNQGIGSKLLKHAEATLIENGVNKILLGKDPWHYFPGIPKEFPDTAEWFERKGYQFAGKEFDLVATYLGQEATKLPQMDGVTFELLNQRDQTSFLKFLNRCFPGRWEYEAIHYFQKGGTGREFVVLKKAGRIIGFCRINDDESPMVAQNVYWAPLFSESLGGVGPLGIVNQERGHGYGLAIVEAGIAFLRQRGIRHIVIDWTGLVDFYKKLGYTIWKSYHTYEKNV
jgi:GNAT superfamily N-acetyltransferase